MRKFIKFSLVALLVLAAGTGAAIYYFAKVKNYDVADQKVDEIIEKQYSIKLPDGTSLPEGIKKDADGSVWIDKNGHYILENGSTVAPEKWMTENSQLGNSGIASANTLADGGNDPNKKVTVDTIKNRYASTFSNLQGQAENQLGTLVGQAKKEYTQKLANGEKINPAYFYQKYSNAADAVESKTDAAFNTVYNTLKNDLKNNNYSTSHAEPFKTSYENVKAQQRNELMKKVTGR
ncbi:hypothetical protein F9802_06565 [Bacillus aerolatus]|uniref:Uncharacterized protein n=1 Tax=Bacillus aerolatus TaxID=2653354 RepID=A0A6I1FRZ2_9BACI|nr:hypothetical protein [Bacillus aerolatus]KAB7707410.1 hypothetical protein F9802_06565 [Bacillus aerolatus]